MKFTSSADGFNPLNATYTVDDQQVKLIDGKSKSSISGSPATVVTRVFGRPISGDLNGDNKPDAVVILVQNGGGTGTFYFVAAAVNADNGTKGTNAIFLGDRIAPQNTQIKSGQIVVNYAIRKSEEDFTVAPSVGVSKYILLDGLKLTEVQ